MLIERPYTSNKTEWIFKVLKQFLKFSFHRSMEQNTNPETHTQTCSTDFFKQLVFFFFYFY